MLLLSPFAPRLDASMGGPRVIAQLIAALGERERVALLYLRDPKEPPLDEEVRAACEFAVETPRLGHRRRGALWKAWKWPAAALRGVPSWVADWHETGFSAALRSIAAGWQPDVVQAEFHLMGQYLRALHSLRPVTVLNQHEPGMAAARDRRRLGLMPGWIVPALEQQAWRRYERAVARWVDAIVTFTERDRREMAAAAPGSAVHVIAPGAVLPEEPADPLGGHPPALLFFGNYLHAPNLDAALRLARDIYPPLREHVPGLRLWLVGDCVPQALSELASDRIGVPGCVPSLAPYLHAAAVVAVPIRSGGGVRVKVLEALGAGKAVVASNRAIEGLGVVPGEHVLLAESDDDFVRQVLWLIRHPEERVSLAHRARAWAVANLGWDKAAARYSALYDELLSGTRRPALGWHGG